MEIEFDGLDAMVERLKALGEAVSDQGARKALRAGGEVILGAMVAAAPLLDKTTAESTALEPGALRAGLRVALRKDADGELEAVIGPNGKVEHVARWVEFGHRQVHGGQSKALANGKTRGNGKVSEVDVPAHPFLRPAFEESVQAAGEAIAASLAETIQEGTR